MSVGKSRARHSGRGRPRRVPNQMKIEGFQGKALVNSFGGDGFTGKLTSSPFKVERRYLRFLIGGGGHRDKTCMQLRVDGKVVRSATGPNTQPGGSERLEWAEWDVGALAGRQATIEIIDAHTGGWGHINVDQIIQTDQKLPALIPNASRTVTLDRKFLRFPVRHGAQTRGHRRHRWRTRKKVRYRIGGGRTNGGRR